MENKKRKLKIRKKIRKRKQTNMKGITNMKKTLKILLSLVLIIAIFLVGYIYAGIKYLPPHYHANFALYIEGERIDFSGDKFMEDVEGCWLSDLIFPKHRVHLHENNPDTIHIHAEGVSWGHFFANNWIIFNDSLISLWDGEQIFISWDDNKKVSFLLNEQIVTDPFNDLIKSEDRLVIVYWENEKISELFVSDNAGEYNSKYDPGSCGWKNEGWILALIKDLIWGHSH